MFEFILLICISLLSCSVFAPSESFPQYLEPSSTIHCQTPAIRFSLYPPVACSAHQTLIVWIPATVQCPSRWTCKFRYLSQGKTSTITLNFYDTLQQIYPKCKRRHRPACRLCIVSALVCQFLLDQHRELESNVDRRTSQMSADPLSRRSTLHSCDHQQSSLSRPRTRHSSANTRHKVAIVLDIREESTARLMLAMRNSCGSMQGSELPDSQDCPWILSVCARVIL